MIISQARERLCAQASQSPSLFDLRLSVQDDNRRLDLIMGYAYPLRFDSVVIAAFHKPTPTVFRLV